MTIIYKTCGICGKSTEKYVNGKCSIVSIPLMGLKNSIIQQYHQECISSDIDIERHCTLCGHSQLKGDTCEKCLVTHHGWTNDDF